MSPEAEGIFRHELQRMMDRLIMVTNEPGTCIRMDREEVSKLLNELAHLRWQTRELQERGTELVLENRMVKYKLALAEAREHVDKELAALAAAKLESMDRELTELAKDRV